MIHNKMRTRAAAVAASAAVAAALLPAGVAMAAPTGAADVADDTATIGEEYVYSADKVEEVTGVRPAEEDSETTDKTAPDASSKDKDKTKDRQEPRRGSGDRDRDRGQNRASGSSDASGTGADKCVVAIDPGHNAVEVKAHDEETGIYMVDYPNGRELADVWEVSAAVAEKLDEAGIVPVLLREDVDEDVDYRERVDRAEELDADVAVSVHTTPGVDYSMMIAQSVGGYRQGPGADGTTKKVTFDNEDVALASKALSDVVAAERSKVEDNPVRVTEQHSFDGRAPLWGGNTPVLSLMSTEMPWLYSELGVASGGGADGITDAEKDAYAEGLAAGLIEALKEADCATGEKSDESGTKSDAAKNKGAEKGRDAGKTERSGKDDRSVGRPVNPNASGSPAGGAEGERAAQTGAAPTARPVNPNANTPRETAEPAPEGRVIAEARIIVR